MFSVTYVFFIFRLVLVSLFFFYLGCFLDRFFFFFGRGLTPDWPPRCVQPSVFRENVLGDPRCDPLADFPLHQDVCEKQKLVG